MHWQKVAKMNNANIEISKNIRYNANMQNQITGSLVEKHKINSIMGT